MLARINRVVDGDDLRLISRQGKKFRSPLFVASFVATVSDKPTRFGFITSKQVGGAVVRNRVKRRLRALAAGTLTQHPMGVEVVVRATGETGTVSFTDLAAEWRRFEEKAFVA